MSKSNTNEPVPVKKDDSATEKTISSESASNRREFIFNMSKKSIEVLVATSAVYVVGNGFKSGSMSAGAK